MKIISLNVVKVLLYLLNLSSLLWSAHSFIHNYIYPEDSCGNLIILIGFGGLNTSFIIIGVFLHWIIQLIHSLGITFLLTISITTYFENSRDCLESNLNGVWYNFNFNTATNIIVLLYYIILGIYSLNKSNEIKYTSLEENINTKIENKNKDNNLYDDDEVFINSEVNIIVQSKNNDLQEENYKDGIDNMNLKRQNLKYCNL